MNKTLPMIGITMGDPVGIGPEILVSSLNDPLLYEICHPIVFGDYNILLKVIDFQNSSVVLNKIESIEKAISVYGTIDIIPVSNLDPNKIQWGCPTEETGKAMIDYITQVIENIKNGYLHAMVTCPITKIAMQLAGSKFHGHTELLADAAQFFSNTTDCSRNNASSYTVPNYTPNYAPNYAMMMAGDKLKVVLVTIHIPLKDVASALTIKRISDTIKVTATSLKEKFGIKKPHIAVAALNPHAGEDGMFGKEEELIIKPAIEQSYNKELDLSGPFPADTLFFKAINGKFDAVVCMYHDQGLIPFKMIHFFDGVNTTIGLPIIRTSVDHGTAYDIAGKNIANSESLKAAIKMATIQVKNSSLQKILKELL